LANFYQKFEIVAILSYLSPDFYTYNVEISVNRTDLGIPQRQKSSSESLTWFWTWPACIALPQSWCILIS